MNDIGFHIFLFLGVGFVIVTIGAFFAERDDAAALRGLPKRFAYFVVGCSVVAGVMLLIEHTLASVN